MSLSRGPSRLLQLLRWCHHKWVRINPTREWLRTQLNCSLRSLDYWSAALRGLHLLKTKQRRRRPAIYLLPRHALAGAIICSSRGSATLQFKKPPKGINRESIKVSKNHTPRKGVQREVSVTRESAETIAGFERFFGLFIAAGKPLNQADMVRAQMQWSRLDVGQRFSALADAEQQLMRTREARFIPLPDNYLAGRPWTRTALPRTLPYINPKTDEALKKHDEVLRLLKESA